MKARLKKNFKFLLNVDNLQPKKSSQINKRRSLNSSPHVVGESNKSSGSPEQFDIGSKGSFGKIES